MKSTVVDESYVFNNNQCTVSRDHNYSSRFNQQYEKPTQYVNTYVVTSDVVMVKYGGRGFSDVL